MSDDDKSSAQKSKKKDEETGEEEEDKLYDVEIEMKENTEREERGEADDQEDEKKEVPKSYRKYYFDEIYGEEYGGEDQNFYPPPSDIDLLMGSMDPKAEQEPAPDEKPEASLSEIDIPLEIGMKSEISEEGLAGEQEDEEDSKSRPGSEKLSLTTISSFEYGTRISEYFMLPKEKTPSELQFEIDFREVVEEKMKKIIRPVVEEEKEKKIEERTPIEKKKLLIAEVDLSGLYPPPKVIESEISFAFEEDEEGEKALRGIQTEADIVQYIMDALYDSLKHDPESIFEKNLKEAIQKVKAVVEEIVTTARKGLHLDIHQKVNESLPHFKTNLKNTLIIRLKEKLGKAETAFEVEEEEEKPLEGEKEKKVKRKLKIRPSRKFEETLKEEIEKEEKEKELEKERKKETEDVGEEKIGRDIKKKTYVEDAKKKPKETIDEAVDEEKKLIPYEKIDWEKYLTESEMKMPIDPTLESEMEEFIDKRRQELQKEMDVVAVKLERKKRFKKPRTCQEMLRYANLYVTMKFILNTGDTFTQTYKYFMAFSEIKEDLSRIFKVPPEVLIIYRDEVEIKDNESAFDLVPEVEPFDNVTFRLLTVDNDRWQMKSEHLELPVPDIITCTIETGQDYLGVPEYKEIVVEIENRKIKKPFVGGYRDKATGTEYHHAFSQSGPHPPKIPWEQLASRSTQTIHNNKKQIDTPTDKSTQMARRDYYVSTEFDKIMTAKPYVEYDTLVKKKDFERKVKTIQRYVRAMIIRKYLKKMGDEYRKRHCWEVEQERLRVLERENKIKTDIINMTYPKTRADFEMLYAMVEKWRKAQIKRISSLKTEAPRKAELCGVLEREIKLLEAIEVHRIAVNKEKKRIKALNFMERVAKPVTWTGYRGMTIKMDTLKTQRARELKELYQSLSRHDLKYQDRIELLISVKYALRVHCTKVTDELMDLINQECELLIRGVKAKDLKYLRQRIEHLFTEYFKDPKFNPEAGKYNFGFFKESAKANIGYCRLCQKMKPIKDFSCSTRETNVNACSTCQWTHNIAVPRVDLNPYRYILKTIRRDEQKRNCYSSCAFILQDEDMRFLIENIWHNRSILSESENLLDLRMPRFDVHKDWTPWNCILLTEMEAKAHLKIDPKENYEPQFVGDIISKHETAKRHFRGLFATSNRLRDSGNWANVVDVKEYPGLPVKYDIHDLTREECLSLKKNGQFEEKQETRRKNSGFVQYI